MRRECLDHLIVVNERHLRRVLGEYVGYYNAARPHQALGLDAPLGRPPAPSAPRRVVARPILGGLHHIYEPAA